MPPRIKIQNVIDRNWLILTKSSLNWRRVSSSASRGGSSRDARSPPCGWRVFSFPAHSAQFQSSPASKGKTPILLSALRTQNWHGQEQRFSCQSTQPLCTARKAELPMISGQNTARSACTSTSEFETKLKPTRSFSQVTLDKTTSEQNKGSYLLTRDSQVPLQYISIWPLIIQQKILIWNQSPHEVLTDFLHAREANICLTREGLHMAPGHSLSVKISSSMSCAPKVQFLLVGNDINLTFWVAGAERFAIINKETECYRKCLFLERNIEKLIH